jgi:hypothetical protein
MTDSHTPNTSQPSSTPASSHPAPSSGSQYEGFDPELPEHDKETGTTAKVSTVQVGASAAAAVTSAVFASFFGVAGTLIGAAVGSIVSTVAGAFYADYLRRAQKVVRNTTTVVVQRIPPERLATSALRRLVEPSTTSLSTSGTRAADPAAVPPTSSLRPVETENADETVMVPVEPGTELLAAVDAAADETRVMPAITDQTIVTTPSSTVLGGAGATGGAVPAGSATATTGSAPQAAQAPQARQAPQTAEQPRSWWRRPVFALPLIGLAGFGIAIGVITATEGVLGHPISGGSGGTTLSRVSDPSPKTSTSTPTSTATVTETETATPSASATEEPSATATAAPSAGATTAPTAGATTAPTAGATTAPSVTAPATQGAGEAAGAVATATP